MGLKDTLIYILIIMAEHVYSVILSQKDPQHLQPEKIKIILKPHQLVGLQKAYIMEQSSNINYNVSVADKEVEYIYPEIPRIYGDFKLKTNIGIIGDIVGFGKTLTALSIIASLRTDDIYVPSVKKHTFGDIHGYMEITKTHMERDTLEYLIKTTLVIVPRGPVYVHWKQTINNNTLLKCISIDNLLHIKKMLPPKISDLKILLESYDVVLIKNTTFLVLMEYYKETDPYATIIGFNRIMIDEAHTIILKIPEMYYKFLWLITSSYKELRLHYNAKSIYCGFLHTIQHNSERLHYSLIKCESDFVRNSFNVPQPIEHYYICKMKSALIAIHSYLTHSVQDKINVNDIAGAIRELGGTSETEEELITLVINDIEKSICNTNKELTFVESLELEQVQKENRLKGLKSDLDRYMTRKQSIEERLSTVMNKICSICHDTLENPIYLECSHMFCGQCIFRWMDVNAKTRNSKVQCPECRNDIDSTKIVAIVKEKSNMNTIMQIMSKEDQLLDIINKKIDGRFLVFSRTDTTFGRLAAMFSENNISHTELKGNTSHMMKNLVAFTNGSIKVILLNTYYAGCGIDISNATDVIIYHSMPHEKIQAIGRAQRVGRTRPLTIHNLCYPHEN